MSGTAFSIAAVCMEPSHRTLREQKFIKKGGAVLFEPGLNGEIILTAAVSTSLPTARYTLIGRSLSGSPDGVEVQLLLRKARFQDGQTATVTSADKGIITLDGIDHVSSASKRFGVDVGSAFHWVQFHIKVPKPIATDGKGEKWGLFGVSLVKDGSKADPLN